MSLFSVIVGQKPTITIETTTDPWMLFLSALKAPATKDKYIHRLTKFLDFLGYQGTKEDKTRAFAARAKTDPIYAFNSVLKFFRRKRAQMEDANRQGILFMPSQLSTSYTMDGTKK